jgi:hypothetical protein
MVERVRFELTIPVKVCRFSRPVLSTAQPSLRGLEIIKTSIYRYFVAEREGFEPSIQVSPNTYLAGKRFRPLSHLS